MQYGIIATEINHSILIGTVIPDLLKCGTLKSGSANWRNFVMLDRLGKTISRRPEAIRRGRAFPTPFSLIPGATLLSCLLVSADYEIA